MEKNKILIIIFIFINNSIAFCQKQSNKAIENDFIRLNQQHEFSNKAGSYKQILNANISTIAPGDEIIISHYITGYGMIDPYSVKIYSTTSASIFDEENSNITPNFGLQKSGFKFSNIGITVDLGGIIKIFGKKYTLFSDAKGDYFGKRSPTSIITEINIDHNNDGIILPVLNWTLKSKKQIKPGQYYITFIMTYFNGESWQNDKIELPIKVMNWHENNDILVKWSALIIAVLTLITLISAIKKDIFKLFTKKNKINPVSDSISKLNKSIEDLINQINLFEKKNTQKIPKIKRKHLKKRRKRKR